MSANLEVGAIQPADIMGTPQQWQAYDTYMTDVVRLAGPAADAVSGLGSHERVETLSKDSRREEFHGALLDTLGHITLYGLEPLPYLQDGIVSARLPWRDRRMAMQLIGLCSGVTPIYRPEVITLVMAQDGRLAEAAVQNGVSEIMGAMEESWREPGEFQKLKGTKTAYKAPEVQYTLMRLQDGLVTTEERPKSYEWHPGGSGRITAQNDVHGLLEAAKTVRQGEATLADLVPAVRADQADNDTSIDSKIRWNRLNNLLDQTVTNLAVSQPARPIWIDGKPVQTNDLTWGEWHVLWRLALAPGVDFHSGDFSKLGKAKTTPLRMVANHIKREFQERPTTAVDAARSQRLKNFSGAIRTRSVSGKFGGRDIFTWVA